MPKSLDAQIEDTQQKILKYQNKLHILKQRKANFIYRRSPAELMSKNTKKAVMQLIKDDIPTEKIIEKLHAEMNVNET